MARQRTRGTSSKKSFPFMKLPRELRDEIYFYSTLEIKYKTDKFIEELNPPEDTQVTVFNGRETGPLLVSRQFYQEYMEATAKSVPSLLIRRGTEPFDVRGTIYKLPQYHEVEIRFGLACSSPSHSEGMGCVAARELEDSYQFVEECLSRLSPHSDITLSIAVQWYPDHRSDWKPPFGAKVFRTSTGAKLGMIKSGVWTWPEFPHHGIAPRIASLLVGAPIRRIRVFGHDMYGPGPDYEENFFPDEMMDDPSEAYATWENGSWTPGKSITKNWKYDEKLGFYQS